MKMLKLFSVFTAAVLLCGCSSTKFTEYHGSEVLQGAGGEERTVDGIDFWEKGDPDRKYIILGVIEESRKHRLPLGVFHEFFQIQATPTIEILLSPKPRTSTEETP